MGKTVRNKRVTDVANTRYEQTRDSPKRKALRKQLTEGLDVLQDTIIKLSGDRELEDRAQRRKFKQADRVNIVVNWLNTICESPSRLAAFRELANIVPVDHVGGGDDATSSEGSGSRRRSTRRATNSRYATRSTARRPPTTAAAAATNGAADQPVPMDSTPSAGGNFEATFQQQQQQQQHQRQPPTFLPYLASDANQMVPDTAETESEGEDDASMFASTTTTTSGTKSPRFASLASLDITKPSSPQSQSALSATVITTTTTTTTTTTSSPKVGGLAHNHTSSTVRLGVTASPLKSLQSMLRELKPPANPTLVIETPPTELAMQYLFDSMATNAGEAALSAMSDFALV